MALLHMAQTLTQFDLDQVKVLHIEPTTLCNIACPQCNRTIGDPYYNEERDRSELTLTKIRNTFSDDFIRQLDKMFMCGNFGEPAAARETLDIFKYFKQINPNITLGMNTNGSLRSTKWWRELAEILSGQFDYVVWSIEGLEDTNHIYRVGARWNKIIDNAQAFIDAGGSAHWDMLIFDYNEHQVDAATEMARELGFTWFRAKVSKRFDYAPVDFLNTPKGWTKPNVVKRTGIECIALKERSVYMVANGDVLPCCWFGAEAFSLDSRAQELVKDLPQLVESWKTDPHPICSSTCGVDEQGTSFDKQWQKEIQLN